MLLCEGLVYLLVFFCWCFDFAFVQAMCDWFSKVSQADIYVSLTYVVESDFVHCQTLQSCLRKRSLLCPISMCHRSHWHAVASTVAGTVASSTVAGTVASSTVASTVARQILRKKPVGKICPTMTQPLSTFILFYRFNTMLCYTVHYTIIKCNQITQDPFIHQNYCIFWPAVHYQCGQYLFCTVQSREKFPA